MGSFQSVNYGIITRNICSWYNDEAWITISGGPWVNRGGVYIGGNGTGIFNFDSASGYSYDGTSFRLVLAF